MLKNLIFQLEKAIKALQDIKNIQYGSNIEFSYFLKENFLLLMESINNVLFLNSENIIWKKEKYLKSLEALISLIDKYLPEFR